MVIYSKFAPLEFPPFSGILKSYLSDIHKINYFSTKIHNLISRKILFLNHDPLFQFQNSISVKNLIFVNILNFCKKPHYKLNLSYNLKYLFVINFSIGKMKTNCWGDFFKNKLLLQPDVIFDSESNGRILKLN